MKGQAVCGIRKPGVPTNMEKNIDLEYKDELYQSIQKLNLMNDDLMTLVFDKNIKAAELLLNIILGNHELKVIEVLAQREYKNSMADGRSIILDIYAVDQFGKVYDIEIQRSMSGADVHRARFHSSMIDTKMLKEGQNFRELHDSYVIFITESDFVGKGLSLYHIERMYKETGELFNDGSHIIYVNGSYKNNEDPVGKLMHDFRCTSYEDMFYSELAQPVKYFKETEGGKKIMGSAFEELAQKVGQKIGERIAVEIAEEKAKEIAEERAKEMAEEKAKEMAEEKAKEMAEEKAKEMAEVIAKDIAEKIAEKRAKEMAEEKVKELFQQKIGENSKEERYAFARRMIARGKLTVEEIAEDADLPIEVVKDLAGVLMV